MVPSSRAGRWGAGGSKCTAQAAHIRRTRTATRSASPTSATTRYADHLSVRARKSVMDLLQAARYSGAVSSHSWSTADVIPRIYKLGGVITPMKESAEEWIKTWRMTKAQRDQRFYFGFGYGSDQNGLSSQPAPREGPSRRGSA